MRGTVWHADNLEVLRQTPSSSIDLIYIDPPFNTGKVQSRERLRTVRDNGGDRTGFLGHRYRTVKLGARSFKDSFDDYLAFLEPRLVEAHRVLKPTAASTSTSTTGRCTTARCCSTASSGVPSS